MLALLGGGGGGTALTGLSQLTALHTHPTLRAGTEMRFLGGKTEPVVTVSWGHNLAPPAPYLGPLHPAPASPPALHDYP